MMRKILLFGGSGLVGSGLKQLLSDRFKIIAPSHTEVDVIHKEGVIRILEQVHPSNIIYAVGLASIDKAEQDPTLAYLLNAKAASIISEKAKSLNIPVLYFSTNAIFDGTKSTEAYQETDKPNPKSIYGKSKLLGEESILANSSKNCVARIIMPYSPTITKRKNFAILALEALKRGEEFYGITDQIINPIYIDDLAEAIHLLIEANASGVYHLGAKDYLTNFEFIKKLAIRFNLDEDLVKGISFEEFFEAKKAPRTKFCWLDTHKFRKKFGKDILHTTDEGMKLLKGSIKKWR